MCFGNGSWFDRLLNVLACTVFFEKIVSIEITPFALFFVFLKNGVGMYSWHLLFCFLFSMLVSRLLAHFYSPCLSGSGQIVGFITSDASDFGLRRGGVRSAERERQDLRVGHHQMMPPIGRPRRFGKCRCGLVFTAGWAGRPHTHNTIFSCA